MAHPNDDPTIAHPQVFTLHWEGPEPVEAPPEVEFADSGGEDDAAEQARELAALRRSDKGSALWEQIEREAANKGDESLWRRRLHAYWWVKLNASGSAGDYARRHGLNHATVRTWISDVAKLAYQVGYRLHEDKLLLVGRAPAALRPLRELVNRDAASPEAFAALEEVEGEFRDRDPYFHLNEGHILRARGRLRESDETLKEGLTIAEAPRVRSLLWNARGQTLWDCGPDSDCPLEDHFEHAEMAFRRAATLDQTTYFPFVNLAQLAVDRRDTKRAEYWIAELAIARKRMDEDMQADLAKYLTHAEWTRPVEEQRFWRMGPVKWIAEAVKKGILPLLALCLVVALASPPAAADPIAASGVDTVDHRGRRGGGGNDSGAGGN